MTLARHTVSAVFHQVATLIASSGASAAPSSAYELKLRTGHRRSNQSGSLPVSTVARRGRDRLRPLRCSNTTRWPPLRMVSSRDVHDP